MLPAWSGAQILPKLNELGVGFPTECRDRVQDWHPFGSQFPAP